MGLIAAIEQKTNLHLHTWLLIILVILNVLDFETTYIAIENGIAEEQNPIIAYFIELFGTTWAVLWVKCAVLFVVIAPYYLIESKKNVWESSRMMWTLVVLNLLYLAVVISNASKIFT